MFIDMEINFTKKVVINMRDCVLEVIDDFGEGMSELDSSLVAKSLLITSKNSRQLRCDKLDQF